MARRIKDAALDSRAARAKLKPRGEPYYRAVERGAHLGYRRRANAAGTWLVRAFNGTAYRAARLSFADDLSDADGVTVLDYWQAVEAVRTRLPEQGRAAAVKSVRRWTVNDALDAYLRMLEGEGRLIADSRCRIDALIRPALGKAKLDELTTDQLRRWRDALAKSPPRLRTRNGEKQKYRDVTDDDGRRARRSSANRVWAILTSALNHAFRDGSVASDRAWRLVRPLAKVGKSRGRYLTVAEAKRLANAADADFRLLVLAALQTGARYGELCALKVADFNADAGTVHIARSKSGKPRHVVLSTEGQAYFRQLCAGRPGDALMLAKLNGRPWGKSEQKKKIDAACVAARLKPAISFHGLRHTWASLAVMNGMPLMVVARNLGHRDTRMIEKHYGHLREDYVAAEIRKAAPTFGFKPDKKITAGPGSL